MTAIYWNLPARFAEDYKYTARVIALIRWLGYIPILFIVVCCFRKREMIRTYKTTIIYAAFAQFALTLPMSSYFFFISFFTSRDLQSTILMCTVVRNGVTILENSGNLVLPTVALGRFIGVVIGFRLNAYFLSLILAFITIPHFYVLFMTIIDGAPIPYFDCSPLLFTRSRPLRQQYTIYMYFPPGIAVLFNLGTLAYVFWRKYSRRSTDGRKDGARDELVVTLGLLAQSIVPTITIGAKGYFSWVQIYLIEVSPLLKSIVEYTALTTVGLNTLASIVFIRAFRVQFMQIIRCHRKLEAGKERSTAALVVQHKSV